MAVDSQISSRELRARVELEWRACAADPVYFFERYWYVSHPKPDEDGNRFRLFKLRQPQREVLEIWVAGEDSITLKARQIGWSTLAAGFAFWRAFFHNGFSALMLSKGERESTLLLSKARFGYKKLPEWMKTRGPKLLDKTLLKMTFSNDSVIESLPSGSDPARGYTGDLLLADEFAFLTNPEEAWASMEPVTDIGGQKIVLSTANGYGNLFHNLWAKAELGETSLVPSFYGWWAVPERDEAWYEQKKKDLQDWQLHQEYPDNPDEAFAKSGNAVFPYDILRELPIREPLRVSNDGFLKIYEEPSPGGVYCLGGDPAEGLGHGDYSSADVLTHDGRQVAKWHGRIPPDEFALALNELGRMYNNALLITEVNNMGIATVIKLSDLGYPNLWVREQPNKVRTQKQDEFGFKTTRTTKPMIITALDEALRQGLAVVDARTRDELEQYVRDEHGRTNGSPFDDSVMSLALANYGREFVFLPRYQVDVKVARFSGDWWRALLDDQPGGDRRIGARNVRRSSSLSASPF